MVPAGAERGHALAQLMAGRYLAHGHGGPADAAAARGLFERAAAQGLGEAAAELARLPAPRRATASG